MGILQEEGPEATVATVALFSLSFICLSCLFAVTAEGWGTFILVTDNRTRDCCQSSVTK